jgi:hypothetical protein
MIAYLFWHCAYPTTTAEQYEEALMRFQQRRSPAARNAFKNQISSGQIDGH